MSEENKIETQTTTEDNSVKNPSTKADEQNVPIDRFMEVNQAKKDAMGQIGKLQAQIDKMNADNKSKAEAKMVEDGKLKEALDLVTKERDNFKGQSEQWTTYQADKRESLMSKLTDDTDKNIAEGLSDLNRLESYVNKVVNVNSPSTSQARATSGKAGDFGGYSSMEEFAMKDPKGCDEFLTSSVKGYQWGKVK